PRSAGPVLRALLAARDRGSYLGPSPFPLDPPGTRGAADALAVRRPEDVGTLVGRVARTKDGLDTTDRYPAFIRPPGISGGTSIRSALGCFPDDQRRDAQQRDEPTGLRQDRSAVQCGGRRNHDGGRALCLSPRAAPKTSGPLA